jgi:Mn-containing catalase
MILRIDRLQVEIPAAEHPDPTAAPAVQELMGGRYGEMSTLMNNTYQSFNFREGSRLKPFYDLVANIAAEEYGHIEAVASLDAEPQVYAPGYHPEELEEIAQRLLRRA